MRIRIGKTPHDLEIMDDDGNALPIDVRRIEYVADGEDHESMGRNTTVKLHVYVDEFEFTDTEIETVETRSGDLELPACELVNKPDALCPECSGSGWFSPTPDPAAGWRCNACSGSGRKPKPGADPFDPKTEAEKAG